MWQKCPICEGSGVIFVSTSAGGEPKCPTCKGHKIIDTLTGYPPKDIIQVTIKESPSISCTRYGVLNPRNVKGL